jgi:hypothetical protein
MDGRAHGIGLEDEGSASRGTGTQKGSLLEEAFRST